MEAVSDYFRSREKDPGTLDDRTWNDLLLDDVFGYLDRTESTVGRQLLYDRLRSAPRRLAEFEALIRAAGADVNRRERAQCVLARLHDAAGYYLHILTTPEAFVRKKWHSIYPLWIGSLLLFLLATVIWPKLLIVVVMGFLINFPVRIVTSGRIRREVLWFRQVGPLLSAARELIGFDTSETAAITGRLQSDLRALSSLGNMARWVSRDPLTTDDLTLMMMESINAVFLMDLNALYFAAGELRSKSEHLLRVIQAVGEIDAAIAVASYRTEAAANWCLPRFLDPDNSAVFAHMRHPLVANAVPNSLTLGPPNGLLVTGSNMSGKSTFLRTIGVNVVLAQTVNTCLAESYRAPVYRVRSSIGRSDDLLAGKSYYLVEVESVLDLVEASNSPIPHLFIFDEIFRGTNAVERIAAGEAVLAALVGNGKPHVALAATHDNELVDLLRDSYSVCHFEDTLGPEGLSFTYHLMPGPAVSRNAIALLKWNGAPDSIVQQALTRAAELDRQRTKLAGATAGLEPR